MDKLNVLIVILLILFIIFKYNNNILTFIIIIFFYIILYLDKNKNIYNYNKILKCKNSTIDNPLGNFLLYSPLNEYDYNLCLNQENEIENNLRYNVYNDSKDLFLTKNSIRPFIKMPNQTQPNDLDKIKKYFYNFDNKVCKYDSINCINYDDLRYHKNYYINEKI